MKLQQDVNLQQKQQVNLMMTQKMQQSIQILKFNASELQDYLAQVELENPFISVSFKEVSSSNQQIADISEFAVETKSQSLFEYLMDQINLTMRKTVLRDWVVYLAQNIDQNGYLTLDTTKLLKDGKIDRTTLDDALTLLWRLDPPGVGARNLQECLLLQIENDRGQEELAYQVIAKNFELFTQRKWDEIIKKMKLSKEEFQGVLDYVKTLSAAPGKAYDQSSTAYIAPDLIVEKVDGKYQARATSLVKPKIVFRKSYYESLVGTLDKNVVTYLKEKKKQYASLLEELQMRQRTIERVGQEIIAHQYDFFAKSNHPLKPLLLRDVAQKLQLHESTISRAVNGKYLQTDFGVFELRSFFSQAVNYDQDGAGISAAKIQEQIQRLIATEDKQKPLSDQKILDKLQADGLKLSRRTVAKYREKLQIPAASKRKRFC
ncbi:RNA polymerase factor sigma-54 [Ligilactobacillus apodemi]|uniref:RNA polymerase factor sigma-54 n=1 Tax=Ligilactobacillus apodemi TaxID=307126 RepID=UPI00214C6574|nr:RNA polymerase factor sigma-54 [Ligilactobacillus apodemi]MCR1900374.1 RNA polymerase factor sigma-54 [Ligilactobacillus apodemi]